MEYAHSAYKPLHLKYNNMITLLAEYVCQISTDIQNIAPLDQQPSVSTASNFSHCTTAKSTKPNAINNQIIHLAANVINSTRNYMTTCLQLD